MLTVAICLVAGLLLGCYSFKTNDAKVPGVITCTIIGGILGLFLAGLLFPVCAPTRKELTEGKRYSLASIIGSQNLEGNFFLLSGKVDSQDYYKFYYVESDGAKIFMKVSKENAKIYEENGKEAYIVQLRVHEYLKNPKSLWVLPFFAEVKAYDGEYAIHVPKGTIKQEIDLSLK